jgi:hypothetical protein
MHGMRCTLEQWCTVDMHIDTVVYLMWPRQSNECMGLLQMCSCCRAAGAIVDAVWSVCAQAGQGKCWMISIADFIKLELAPAQLSTSWVQRRRYSVCCSIHCCASSGCTWTGGYSRCKYSICILMNSCYLRLLVSAMGFSCKSVQQGCKCVAASFCMDA